MKSFSMCAWILEILDPQEHEPSSHSREEVTAAQIFQFANVQEKSVNFKLSGRLSRLSC